MADKNNDKDKDKDTQVRPAGPLEYRVNLKQTPPPYLKDPTGGLGKAKVEKVEGGLDYRPRVVQMTPKRAEPTPKFSTRAAGPSSPIRIQLVDITKVGKDPLGHIPFDVRRMDELRSCLTEIHSDYAEGPCLAKAVWFMLSRLEPPHILASEAVAKEMEGHKAQVRPGDPYRVVVSPERDREATREREPDEELAQFDWSYENFMAVATWVTHTGMAPEKDLWLAAAEGYLQGLNPQLLISAEDIQTALLTTQYGERPFEGIGVLLTSVAGEVLVHQVLPDGPAHKAGLKAAEVVTVINAKSVAGMRLFYVAQSIRNAKGEPVELSLRQAKKKSERTLEIEPQTIQPLGLRTAFGLILHHDDKLGWIRLVSC